jgi:hypothetical protein
MIPDSFEQKARNPLWGSSGTAEMEKASTGLPEQTSIEKM